MDIFSITHHLVMDTFCSLDAAARFRVHFHISWKHMCQDAIQPAIMSLRR